MHRRFCCVRGGHLPEAEASLVPEPQRGRITIQRLFRRKVVIVAGLGLAILVAAAVGYKLRGVLVPAVEALVRGIPIPKPQALILPDLPMAQGPRISLFNG